MDFSILYEDLQILAIDKPSGVLVLPDRWQREKSFSILGVLRKKYASVYVIHRLDKDVSGVLLFAKTKESHREFSKMFEKRKIKKKYLGLVHGHLSKEEGVIRKPIAPCRKTPGLMVIDRHHGKHSQTHIKVLDDFGKYHWLEISTATGRTHQIRVHLTSIGCPLVCDPLYGIWQDAIYLSTLKRKFKKKRGEDEKPLLSKLALHASSLAFCHPFTSEELYIEAPLRKDMKAVYYQLKVHSTP